MSDFDAGGAAAPADSASVAVIDAEPVAAPNPIEVSEPAQAEPVKAEKAPSIDEALDRATAKVEKDAKTAKPEPVKAENNRDETTGKFASKEPAEKPAETVVAQPAPEAAPKPATPANDAPTRFSPDAKAAWETAPEPVKAEVHRAIRELEQGHQKYRADAESFEPVRKFHDMARQQGTTLDAALEKYTNIEAMLEHDPVRALNEICNNRGISLRDVAAHVMGQTPDQQASQSDATIRELKQQIAALTESVGGVTQTFARQQQDATLSQVETFARDNPRINDEAFAEDVTFFLGSNKVPAHLPPMERLSEAYKLAERLNPAPAQAAAVPALQPAPTLVAQTDKGTKSISGAPSSGSNPAVRKSASSIDESLDRAFATRRSG